MRVLFVDDDHAVCELLTTVCSALDVDFEVVTRAEDALEKLAAEEFALCVTDLTMPAMDGVTLANQIRKQYPDMGVFAFTGESSSYPLRELDTVFDKIYLKPSDYSRMIADSMKFLAIRKYPFLA